MTNEIGFLRQVPAKDVASGPASKYQLSEYGEVAIGRDRNCQIALESIAHGMVSRRHAAVRPLTHGNWTRWQICDLNSANGTYINGQKLEGCQTLETGDRISLGQDGPEFIFESPATPHPTKPQFPATKTGNFPVSEKDALTLTQLFPIASTGKQLSQKAYLYPGIATVIFVVSMFVAVGNSAAFNFLLSAYLAGAAYYFIYQLCGKHKPWWVLLGTALATVLILLSPLLIGFILVFREILPGRLPAEGEEISFLPFLIRMFFGAGLMEELLKALPVLGALLLGNLLKNPWRDRIGVWEPLDGILLGSASAVSFTLLETLGQYVPHIIQNVTLQAGPEAGQLVGLQLLIPRILGSAAGHMAYSGYLGYFIGLSALKPTKRWQILGVGYFSASALHALWNASGAVSVLLLALVGVLSYAFLVAAILKARALSPNRSQNFATRIFSEK
ncbi:MAG: PrsW family intramembrane metalloprotease [Microcoleus sp. PH2017_10_PVI_O_A]|uniref:PrsW family glutamic-type intramembrane protease n=1 Tax=unclassified Microcoleus TaxID=2642155 RepID=UPI001DEDB1FD|nr:MULTISPECIES: PrsW family glutamic-type intramembrane protease [unclassified Microcoleus]TAE80170.1 MAG: PrsW family intramembrane metalloprotease [Oscillatoriales cyanobacterium]MCC3404581.1 PrsW family intramembrane metalloprotease [Microcoleus sp. PH2017_10_PVI_O_A]MCC3461908.1 PrsW family intramembrane metalloprotease [Microcoleus sp. PH2017_11_PCY_U_A]MCC3480294.1 PrsW family intramembrane metalloprotease [Microcoleus sp. PH2017_12_PCY_D_A]MCC3527039.1 PrsW family intramembrane metallo